MNMRVEAATGASFKPWTIVGTFLLATALAAITVASPIAGALVGAALWGSALILSVPSRASVLVPVILLLSLPADFIRPLSEGVHGFFVLGTVSLLCAISIIRDPSRRFPFADWDLLLLPFLLIVATLAHSQAGELRGILLWGAAGLFLIWLRSEERRNPGARSQVENAILIAGSIAALFAMLDAAGLDLSSLIPGYEPERHDSFLEVGAVGLSGHHLRLGSLTMLASLVGLARLLSGSARDRGVLVSSILSMIGLGISGARGSWLGFLAGSAVLIVWGNRGRLRHRVALSTALVLFLVALVWTSGVWKFFYDRAIGSSSHPASLEQRLQVLQAFAATWSQLPLLGLGFGGASEKTMAMGLQVLNIENEYIRLFLAGGWLAVVALLLLAVRRIYFAALQVREDGRSAALAGWIALLVNLATYNFFAWSFGPSLFYAFAVLSSPQVARKPAPHREVGR